MYWNCSSCSFDLFRHSDQVGGYIVPQGHDSLELVKIVFLNVMHLCKPIWTALTSRSCFKRSEHVQTTTKVM